MKHIFILLLSVFGANSLFAQAPSKLPVAGKHAQVLTTLLSQNSYADAVSKTTTGVPTQRVIAQSIRDNTLGTLSDSIKLGYTGLRNSKYDYNRMMYAYNYPYSTSPMFNFLGVFTK